MFAAHVEKALAGDLDASKVKTRSQAGQQLSYIEGWQVIAEANRIFGFGAWSSHTVELRAVSETAGTDKYGKPRTTVTYIARVRVEVQSEGGVVTREGVGAGHGMGEPGQAHEKAIKEAETDARKRALMTLGNKFGLALYDKEQRGVSHGADDVEDTPAAAEREPTPAPARPAPGPVAQRAMAATAQPEPTRTSFETGSHRILAALRKSLTDCATLAEVAHWDVHEAPKARTMIEDHKAALRAERTAHRAKLYANASKEEAA